MMVGPAQFDQPLKITTIIANTNDVNHRTQAGSPAFPTRNRLSITGSAVVGSTNTATSAYSGGTSWPKGSVLEVVVGASAVIAGKGGAGGNGATATLDADCTTDHVTNAAAGSAGGPAVDVAENPYLVLFSNNGTIGGGGGGGGGGGSVAELADGGAGGAGIAGGGGGGAGAGSSTSSGGSVGTASNSCGTFAADHVASGSVGGNTVSATTAGSGGAGGAPNTNGRTLGGAGGNGGSLGASGSSGTAALDTNGTGITGSNASGGAAGNCTTSGSNARITWVVSGTRLGTLG